MSSRKLALVRSAHGPWIPTAHIKVPLLKVTGLAKARVRVLQKNQLGESEAFFEEDGLHKLEPASWMRVFSEPLCHTLICEITSGQVA